MFLEKKLENKSRLEALRARLAQSVSITPEADSYDRGEMVRATVHGQEARVIIDGPGTQTWITRDFLHKLKDARFGAVLRVRGGGELWSSFEAIIYNMTYPEGRKLPLKFYGRKTVDGVATAVTMLLQVVDDPIMRIRADVGLRASEYEIANSPAEAILERPFPQFPFNIMDIKESAPRFIRQGVSTADAVVARDSSSLKLTCSKNSLLTVATNGCLASLRDKSGDPNTASAVDTP